MGFYDCSNDNDDRGQNIGIRIIIFYEDSIEQEVKFVRSLEMIELQSIREVNRYVSFVDRQVFKCEQTNGTVEIPKFDRSTNKNMVSKSSHQVEETTYLQIKDCPKARAFPIGILSTSSVLFITVLHHAACVWNFSVR